MRYLIVGCNNDKDTVFSMYMYYLFISNAGFDVYCYIDNNINNEFESLGINSKFAYDIKEEDKIILLNNDKFYIPNLVNSNMVTEIISLKDNNFSKFQDANIKIDDVCLLITIIIERYREYKMNITTDMCKVLKGIYSENIGKLSNRDKIAFDYINILCE